MDIENVCFSNSLGAGNSLFNAFLVTMATLHCNITSSINWPQDYGETALRYGLDDYDFVVVGAGTAGSVVAGRLAENRHTKVLLIEAGDDPPIESEVPGFFFQLFGSAIDWNYRTEPEPNSCLALKGGTCGWNKGKTLGGSHAVNGIVHIRGPPADYDEWEELGNPTWGYNDLKYFFRKTEKFNGNNPYGSHGEHGPMNVEYFPIPQFDQKLLMKAAKELGHPIVDDFCDGPDIGFGRVHGSVENGRRMTTAKAFLTMPRPNLHVIKNAVAYKIDFTKDRRAKRVRFMYKDRYKMVVEARKEIILSAGSIETPKLMMLSGIGPKSHLESLGIPVIKDLPVGHNLLDHIRVDMYIRYKYGKDKDIRTEFLDTIYNHWVHRKGLFSTAHVDLSGFLATDGHSTLPDIQIMFRWVENATLDVGGFKDSIGMSIANRFDNSDRILSPSVILAKPRSRGYLKLKSSDYRDDPLIYRNYFDHPNDLKRLAKGLKEFVKFEQTEAFQKIDGEFVRVDIPECDRERYGSLEYWKCYARYMSNTVFHYAGTTKMGPKTDKWAVVNPELEVYGVKGLRVIDAGIMPTMVRVNTNPAVVMIGEKGADFIKNKWNL